MSSEGHSRPAESSGIVTPFIEASFIEYEKSGTVEIPSEKLRELQASLSLTAFQAVTFAHIARVEVDEVYDELGNL